MEPVGNNVYGEFEIENEEHLGCVWGRYGTLTSNDQSSDLMTLNGVSEGGAEGCSDGFAATGTLASLTFTASGKLKMTTEEKLTITHEGCTYQLDKATLPLRPIPGSLGSPEAELTLKRDKKASAKTCEATKVFTVASGTVGEIERYPGQVNSGLYTSF